MSNPAHDQAALDAATAVMDLVRGPVLLGEDAQLKACIQCLLIDLLKQHGNTPDARAEEHEHIGYINPSALFGLLAGSDTTTTISSAIPSLIQPAPTPPENWAVPIYVMRRPGEQP
ncbi:hypothetical protein [Pseudomonas oryzihabitans]|uniref:hypothetical protein n=1 Tax=Pseudomonas oryzihabitans TaxID=47885 RepID=UPI00289E0A94|nr:hypothetical protein [Pseudomonas oryzihabitans]